MQCSFSVVLRATVHTQCPLSSPRSISGKVSRTVLRTVRWLTAFNQYVNTTVSVGPVHLTMCSPLQFLRIRSIFFLDPALLSSSHASLQCGSTSVASGVHTSPTAPSRPAPANTPDGSPPDNKTKHALGCNQRSPRPLNHVKEGGRA